MPVDGFPSIGTEQNIQNLLFIDQNGWDNIILTNASTNLVKHASLLTFWIVFNFFIGYFIWCTEKRKYIHVLICLYDWNLVIQWFVTRGSFLWVLSFLNYFYLLQMSQTFYNWCLEYYLKVQTAKIANSKPSMRNFS